MGGVEGGYDDMIDLCAGGAFSSSYVCRIRRPIACIGRHERRGSWIFFSIWYSILEECVRVGPMMMRGAQYLMIVLTVKRT